MQKNRIHEHDISRSTPSRVSGMTAEGSYILKAKREVVQLEPSELPFLTGRKSIDHNISLDGNIERFFGYAQIPIGLAGPLLINENEKSSEFHVPLATTEGALVASYNRGMKALYLSNGVNVQCVELGVQRAPFFKFSSLVTATRFLNWVKTQENEFQNIVESTSDYAYLKDIHYLQEGNSIIITFTFETGAASGQNMVTIATDAICKYLVHHTPEEIVKWYIEGNYAGDKKATFKALNGVRGKRVIAECTISRKTVIEVLKSTPEAMCDYWAISNLAMLQSGSIGNLGHVANALTAIFIACGQDVACVSESSTGIVRLELTPENDLYVALTLPSLIVGTVGGGTGLSTQKECLRILDCDAPEHADKFAKICCATALAGELSIAAAIVEGHFTSAHQSLGRRKK